MANAPNQTGKPLVSAIAPMLGFGTGLPDQVDEEMKRKQLLARMGQPPNPGMVSNSLLSTVTGGYGF